jgi:D-serine deaminase-like pyridoxal phosphate-dependent protein
VLVEGEDDVGDWLGAPVAVFVDVDIGLGRTGLPVEDPRPIVELARAAVDRGLSFAGLHAYEGDASSRDLLSSALDRLAEVADALARAGVAPGEVVTSGSLTAGWAREHPGLAAAAPLHSLSPGTVVFHDLQSELHTPWRLGLRPAVGVLTRVVSSARPTQVTCDAGHKAVSADCGDPVAVVAGRPELSCLTPSEEHLPLAVAAGAPRPSRGEVLALVPRHVCPTVNLHDKALLVRDGQSPVALQIAARGHEAPEVSAR